jgi:3-dehydroquinate synthase
MTVTEILQSVVPDYSDLALYINRTIHDHKVDKVFLICDRNTSVHCVPLILQNFPAETVDRIFVLPPGEKSKEMPVVLEVLQWLAFQGASRNSLIVNVGGGVVSDLGGFAASIFKRGIPVVNIPTTLLAQIDAAYGGKTGVNQRGIKNQIGTIWFPVMVYVNPHFLHSLPDEHRRSGLGELLKYALIGAGFSPEELGENRFSDPANLNILIGQCVDFKTAITSHDPLDLGLRRILNFGHTFGHAFETANAAENHTLTHGEAVAAGIVAETYCSVKINGLSQDFLNRIVAFYLAHFPIRPLNQLDPLKLITLMKHDKKNAEGSISSVLLDRNAQPTSPVPLTDELIIEALGFLHHLKS